jgi:hypothetical protein
MPPTNISAATATLITVFPFEETIDISGLSGVHEVWYAWDVEKNDRAHYFQGIADSTGSGSVVEVILSIYRGTAENPVLVITTEGTGGRNFIQYGEVPLERRYLKLTTETTGSISTLDLTVTGQEDSEETMPAGSIVILSDALQGDTDPGIILSDDGTVARHVNTVVGETGAILANGILAVHDSTNTKIVLYDTTKGFKQIGSWAVPGEEQFDLAGVAAVEPDSFMVISGPDSGGSLSVHLISQLGILTQNIGSVTGLGAGVSSGNLAIVDGIGYYAALNGGSAIKRFNVSTGVTLTNFLADRSIPVQNILGLPDDSILIAWYDGQIRRYDAAASILTDYSSAIATEIGDGFTVNHIALNWNEPDTFIVRLHDANLSYQIIIEIDTTTGAEVSRFTNPLSNGFAPPEGVTFDSEWGQNASCPLIITTTPVPPMFDTPPISEPCCCSCPEPPTGPGPTGPILPPEPPEEPPEGIVDEPEIFQYFPQCVGGGITPSAAPLLDSEVYL